MRKPETYRSERRNAWKATRLNGLMAWSDYNTPAPKYHLGTLKPKGHISTPNRSAYMPHDGGGRYAIDRLR